MAANKYISNNAGILQEVAANQVSAGAGDAGKIVALTATGQIDLTMMPTGVGPDIEAVVASETIASGAYVNLWSNAGVTNVRNADASAASPGKPADGYVLVGGASLATLSVYFLGRNTGVTGRTPGAKQFLSDTTPGAALETAPTTSAHMVQSLGKAVTATDVNVEINPSYFFLA